MTDTCTQMAWADFINLTLLGGDVPNETPDFTVYILLRKA